MAKEPDVDTPVSVTQGDVHVEKSFSADRFPVPAIAFTISSTADDPVRVRLVDEIPESFSMEGIGFHPDYESDNWTAFRDHRVEYERTLEPGEEVETVYGIRIEDPELAEEFLTEPTIELVEEGEGRERGAAGRILGRDTTEVVRNALSGEEELPGLEGQTLLGETAPEPRTLRDDTVAAVTRREEGAEVTGEVTEEVSMTEEAETEAEAADETAEEKEEEAESPLEAEETGAIAEGAAAPVGTAEEEAKAAEEEAPGEPAAPAVGAEGLAAALAEELRAGNVAEEDLDVLRDHLDVGTPKSVDVRIGRLQSQIQDVVAYRDALAEFLDENGTAEELLGEFEADLDSLESRVEDVDSSLSAAATDRSELKSDVADLHETMTDVEEKVTLLDEELGDVREDIAALDERLVTVEEDVTAELDEIRDEFEEIREFRDRLSSAFGPGGE